MVSKSRLLLGSIFGEFVPAALRFPLPLACALGFCFVWIAENHNLYAYSRVFRNLRAYDDGLLIFFPLGFLATLAMQLLAERLAWSRVAILLSGSCALALIAWPVFTRPVWPEIWLEGYLMFLGPALALLVLSSAFVSQPRSADDFWNFNRATGFGAVFGFLVASAVAVGLVAALIALLVLFDLKIASRLSEDALVVSFALLWPWLTLTAVPASFEAPKAAACPAFLARLTNLILVPLSLVYLTILYAYGLKILFDWSLPDGRVAGFIVVYAAYGVAVHLVAYPLRATGPRLTRLFHRWFFAALLPLVLLLALAVWLRIEGYGVTEQRYLLAALTLWLAGLALWLWRKPDRNLVFIPFSLALILGAASLGPWGAVSVSTASQLARLEVRLTEQGLLKEGRIVPAERQLELTKNKDISSIVDYLERTRKLAALRPWFESSGLEFPERASRKQILDAFALPYVSPGQGVPKFSFRSRDPELFETEGFDILLDWSGYRHPPRTQTVPLFDGSGKVHFDRPITTLTVTGGQGQELSFDLIALVESLESKGRPFDPRKDLTLEKRQSGLRVRIHVVGLEGSRPATGPVIRSFRAFILVGRDPS